MSKGIARDILQGWDIALIDDDFNSLEIAGMLLRHYGAAVHTAGSGRDGLEVIARVKPRLIITDLSMPEMDGWQMIAQLKAQPDTASIPIIALTAHAMTGDREKAIAAGCNNYMTKPLSAATFIPELVRMLAAIPELGLTV